jgi:hypothetical protein
MPNHVQNRKIQPRPISDFGQLPTKSSRPGADALRTADRPERLIGIRLVYLKRIGRNEREAKAKGHVPQVWLESLKRLQPRIKRDKLTVYEFFRELAKIAGLLGQTGHGEPGWQITWQGILKNANAT